MPLLYSVTLGKLLNFPELLASSPVPRADDNICKVGGINCNGVRGYARDIVSIRYYLSLFYYYSSHAMNVTCNDYF